MLADGQPREVEASPLAQLGAARSIEAGKCYVLKFDVSNVGGAAISISFDDNVEDVALSEIELND